MAAGPLSQAVKELRRKLAQPGQEMMPQTEFAQKIVGGGISPSLVSRMESGDARPSDQVLERIAKTFPNIVDFDELIRLRDEEYGAPKKRGRKPKNQQAASADASSNGTQGTVRTESTPVVRSVRPTTTMDWRERYGSGLGRAAAAAPALPASRTPVSRPVSSESNDQRSTQIRGAHEYRFFEAIIPVLERFSSSLGTKEAVRYVCAVTMVVERLLGLISKKDGVGGMDVQAASLMIATDFWSLQSGEVMRQTPDNREQLETLLQLAPERWQAYQELCDILPGILGDADTFRDAVATSLLKALSLGAHRG